MDTMYFQISEVSNNEINHFKILVDYHDIQNTITHIIIKKTQLENDYWINMQDLIDQERKVRQSQQVVYVLWNLNQNNDEVRKKYKLFNYLRLFDIFHCKFIIEQLFFFSKQ